MPQYCYACNHQDCDIYTEISHSMSECDNPKPETVLEITCPVHNIIMKRVPQETLLNGASGTEKQLLNAKQALLKERSKSHTALTASEIKHPEDRARMMKKYKNFKAKDPDKIIK